MLVIQHTELPSEQNGSIFVALASLLARARSALPSDLDAADECLRKASQMLQSEGDAAKPGLVVGGLAPWQLKNVSDHVVNNLTDQLGTADLAEVVHLSSGHFARAFKTSVGCTPHSYILLQRIERAKQLMLATGTPLCEIALMCGWADQSHLSRMFRRYVGHSPAAWRRMNAGSVS